MKPSVLVEDFDGESNKINAKEIMRERQLRYSRIYFQSNSKSLTTTPLRGGLRYFTFELFFIFGVRSIIDLFPIAWYPH